MRLGPGLGVELGAGLGVELGVGLGVGLGAGLRLPKVDSKKRMLAHLVRVGARVGARVEVGVGVWHVGAGSGVALARDRVRDQG